jgi:atlastin
MLEIIMQQIIFPAKVGLPGRQRTILDLKVDKTIIHEEVLRQLILHREVKDRKIVSLSIVGAFRKGKSFLLDYMLRYLYSTVSFS